MKDQGAANVVDPEVVATILVNAANLMASFHKSDVALQNALSALTAQSTPGAAMHELQHIDLITQVHADLAKMLPVLADGLRTTTVTQQDLCAALTLRSLQQALIDPDEETEEHSAGELSLF